MRKVEPQSIGRDKRTLLRDMVAEHLTQRFVQNMGGGVIGARRAPARMINVELQRLARDDGALFDNAFMDDEIAELLQRIGDAKARIFAAHDADVADLAARFAVKGRLIENDGAALACRQVKCFDAVVQ